MNGILRRMKRSPPGGEAPRAGEDAARADEAPGAEGAPATGAAHTAPDAGHTASGEKNAGATHAAPDAGRTASGEEKAGADAGQTASGEEKAGADAGQTASGEEKTGAAHAAPDAGQGGAAGDDARPRPSDGATPPPLPGLLSEPGLGTPQAAAPVAAPAADPATPAGLDPAEAAARPPTGRRGRLRRRLRYLRRARELMLRDLGGLVYEVHRTGGGDLPAHAGLLGAKLERLVALDREARTLEAALSAPREQVILFEPGVGGTCAVCGELYGSDARFCAHCGTSTTTAPQAAAEAPESERAPTLAERGAGAGAASVPEPPPAPAAPGAEAPTSVLPAAGEEPERDPPAGSAERANHGSGGGERADPVTDADTDVWRTPDTGEEAGREARADELWAREERR
jgi:hypothetical protein